MVFIFMPLGSGSEYQSSFWYKEDSFIIYQTENLLEIKYLHHIFWQVSLAHFLSSKVFYKTTIAM